MDAAGGVSELSLGHSMGFGITALTLPALMLQDLWEVFVNGEWV